MKIVVLGGAGEAGREVVRDLAACPEFDEVVVADVDRDRADELVDSLGATHATAVGLDVGDREAALASLRGAHLLMNCTSFKLFDQVIDLAIEARVDYADLISEPTPAQQHAARQAGITAISGLGVTPGLSNVLVRHAADELGELDEVHISWVSFRTVAPTRGLLDTILWELSESCDTRKYFQNGRYEPAAALDGSRLVSFQVPVGAQRVYFVPHPEVRTLPRNFPSLRFCAVRGSWRPELMDDMRVLSRYGLLSSASLETTKRCIWERFGGRRDQAPWPLYVNVEVLSVHGDEWVRRVYDVSHPIEWGQLGVGRMTGIPAAVGAQLLARHGRVTAGFVDPERYYDPVEFLGELQRRDAVAVTWSDSSTGAPPPV